MTVEQPEQKMQLRQRPQVYQDPEVPIKINIESIIEDTLPQAPQPVQARRTTSEPDSEHKSEKEVLEFFINSSAEDGHDHTDIKNILYEVIQNDQKVNKILNHGCHCKLLNDQIPTSDKFLYGGNTIQSELDQICKNWLNSRRCLLKMPNMVHFGEIMENFCYMEEVGYTLFGIERGDNTKNETGRKAYDFTCGSGGGSGGYFPTSRCQIQLCITDLQYVNKIKDFINDSENDDTFLNDNMDDDNLTSQTQCQHVKARSLKSKNGEKDTCCISNFKLYSSEIGGYENCA